ncbi:FAD-dependent monooxygenase [Dyella acidiphila]|uniref:FAD-dependent monooxygenase n=1 Tax=Dyella acidiphila TaxID=2775866 RepID=A0ABR9GEX8_9GAMM|nr:FAD-dependent monooxygenase [Dyella acidiphila]MBE1162600.1 FAD-dependent monooxygenase [Dyella acidiphila]
MSAHAVAIAGAGPTGLMLAGELALAGIDVALIERRSSQELIGSRALGLHTRSIEVLDQRGIAERFLSQGRTYPMVHFQIPLDISDFPTRHNYVLGLVQRHVERILAEWVVELGVPIYREREVTGFTQYDEAVEITLADGQSLRAQYLVGCDGGRSLIRKMTGIDFAGADATVSWLIVEAELREEPVWGFRHDAIGTHAIGKLEDGDRAVIVLTERQLESGQPTLQDIRAALIATYGTDYGIHSPSRMSRFNDMARQATHYRQQRVLLAGDAAHVHAPLGGQGLNLGMQDAVNLGWKLAQVLKRISPESLLDTYQAERHPVAARVLQNSLAQVALRRPDPCSKALADLLGGIFAMDEPRKRLVGMMSGLDVHYDFGEGHPLLGRRMPDLDLLTAAGTVRVFSLLHDAQPLLLHFGAPGGIDITPWRHRVRMVDASYTGAWELPVLGSVPAPGAVLVRPDGHVAWVGDAMERALEQALHTWFGAPEM